MRTISEPRGETDFLFKVATLIFFRGLGIQPGGTRAGGDRRTAGNYRACMLPMFRFFNR